jgi:hypothetical protein
MRQLGVDTALFGPAVDEFDSAGQPRRVEADLDLHALEHRREHRSAADFVLALGLFLFGDLGAVQLEAAQLLGRAGDHDRPPAVADRQHRRQHGADVFGKLLEKFGDAFRVDVGHRHHRCLVSAADHAPAA